MKARIGAGIIPGIVWIGKEMDDLARIDIRPGRYWLKANHGSGFVRSLTWPEDYPSRRNELRGAVGHWLASNYNLSSGEWWYNNFEKLVYLEEHIGTVKATGFTDFTGVMR